VARQNAFPMTEFMKKRGAWGLASLCAVAVVAGWRPIASTFALAWNNDQYTHILLILPVSLALIYLEWPAVKSMTTVSWRAGSILLVSSVFLASLIEWWFRGLKPDVKVALGMFALVLWCIGAFVFCFGTKVSRSLTFPLCFLFWLVPFPAAMLNATVAFLQRESTLSAYVLFSMTGVPVAKQGFFLTIPGLTVQVAQECSSIRSSLMLLVTTMVLAQLSLRSKWRKVLVVALAVPLSVAKNAVRIFVIAMLGTRVDPGFLTGRLHHQGGIVFFLFALVSVFVLLWLLQRSEPSRRQTVLHAAQS
jgi:exosortase